MGFRDEILKKLISASNWLNTESRFNKIILNIDDYNKWLSIGFLITIFCYSITVEYFNFFDINYFLYFNFSDIYSTSLGLLSFFDDFNEVIVLYLYLMSFGYIIPTLINFISKRNRGFKHAKNMIFVFGNKKFSSNKKITQAKYSYLEIGLIMILGVFPLIVFLSFVIYIISMSLSFTLSAVIIFLIGIVLYNVYRKNFDIFLYIAVIAITYILGMNFGRFVAKENSKYDNEFTVLLNSKNELLLEKSQIIIGQNSTTFITFNKKDSIVEFIPKAEVKRVRFKGSLKPKKEK